MNESEFWRFVAQERAKLREEEGVRSVLEFLEKELEEARAWKEHYFRNQELDEYWYWDGYVGGLLTAIGLLKKFLEGRGLRVARRRPRPGDITTIRDLFKFKSTWVVILNGKQYGRSMFKNGEIPGEVLEKTVKVEDVWIIYGNWLYFCKEVV